MKSCLWRYSIPDVTSVASENLKVSSSFARSRTRTLLRVPLEQNSDTSQGFRLIWKRSGRTHGRTNWTSSHRDNGGGLTGKCRPQRRMDTRKNEPLIDDYSIDRSIDSLSNRLIIIRPNVSSIDWLVDWWLLVSFTDRWLFVRFFDLLIDRSFYWFVNPSILRSINCSFDASIDPPIYPSIDPPIDPSTYRSIHLSIHRSIDRSIDWLSDRLATAVSERASEWDTYFPPEPPTSVKPRNFSMFPCVIVFFMTSPCFLPGRRSWAIRTTPLQRSVTDRPWYFPSWGKQ